jgi:REP element-mobilizing transposase RayT
MIILKSDALATEPEAKSLGSENNKACYHFVFNTYKRKSVLTDPMAVDFLYKVFYDISNIKGFHVVSCNILADHVHCLIEFDLKHRVDYVIRMIKGISSREFFKKFNTNRFIYRKLWGRSYFAEQINPIDMNRIIDYINGQTKAGIDKRYI